MGDDCGLYRDVIEIMRNGIDSRMTFPWILQGIPAGFADGLQMRRQGY